MRLGSLRDPDARSSYGGKLMPLADRGQLLGSTSGQLQGATRHSPLRTSGEGPLPWQRHPQSQNPNTTGPHLSVPADSCLLGVWP